MNSEFLERLARLAPVRADAPVRSFSERRIAQHFIRTGRFAMRITVAHRLREAGLTLGAAHKAITELAEFDHTTCDIPDDVDMDALAADLLPLDVVWRPDAAVINLVRIFDRDPRIVEDAMLEPLP